MCHRINGMLAPTIRVVERKPRLSDNIRCGPSDLENFGSWRNCPRSPFLSRSLWTKSGVLI